MKEDIRKRILSLRDGLSEEDVKKKSDAIKQKLFSLPGFQNAKSVLFYLSKDNEVFTNDMVKECFGKKKVLVPFVKKGVDLGVCEIDSFDSLEKGGYNVLEPVNKEDEINPEGIDLVIVPGVAFDSKGNRIGYGKGYYDRFLKRLNPDCKKIGLAFDFQVVDEIMAEDFDVAVDEVVSD